MTSYLKYGNKFSLSTYGCVKLFNYYCYYSNKKDKYKYLDI